VVAGAVAGPLGHVEDERARDRGFGAADGRDVPADRGTARRPASVVSVSLLLDAMLSGPAALAGARYGTHDWELLSVSEREFRMLRSQFHELWQTR
jgi:hypothetical protein